MNTQRAFLLLLIGISGLATVLLVFPFLEYVLAGIILGYVLYPLQRRLAPRVGERAAPILLIAGTVVTGAIPLLYIFLVFVRDLQAFARGETGLQLEEIESTIEGTFGVGIDLREVAIEGGQNILNALFGSVSELFAVGLHATLGIALVLFVVYYVLRDGEEFVAWLHTVIPLSPPMTRSLFERVHRTTWGVVIGHIFAAVLQGVVAGIGLYLAGLPRPVFWTAVMIVLALLPLIGAFLVWGSASAYLALIGQPTAGLILALYGVFVVSAIDEYGRPILIDQQARLNPAVILVGVFGGVYTLGFAGLFVGPIVIAVFAATLVTFRDEYERL
ncbi:MAG: AI-2E family transporter [Haloferacaceae archaeon]